MLEPFIHFLESVPWEGVLVIAFCVTCLENLFPPAPCDSILLFTGTLVGIHVVGFVPLLICGTLGSTVGFTIMFYLGRKLGNRLIESKRFKYINEENIKKPRLWLNKYGYFLIVINRFITGTRAVISFLAGISELKAPITIVLSAASALIWNTLLIGAGMLLGDNWRLADHYLKLYGTILTPIIVVIILFFVLRWYRKYKRSKVKEVY